LVWLIECLLVLRTGGKHGWMRPQLAQITMGVEESWTSLGSYPVADFSVASDKALVADVGSTPKGKGIIHLHQMPVEFAVQWARGDTPGWTTPFHALFGLLLMRS
jgi:hypothetical protein